MLLLQVRIKRALEELERSEAENKRLRAELEATQEKLKKARIGASKARFLTKRERQRWQEKAKHGMSSEERECAVREVLSPLFTEAQISCYLRGDWQRCRRWTEEDISLALTIRLLHKKTYIFLRSSKILPLPGLTTLERHFRDFRVPEGFLDSVARLISVKAKTMTDRQKLCSLSFDEMHIKSDVQYNRREDQVVGPFSSVNCVLLRGVCGKWKIPIFYAFNKKKIAKEEFLDIIYRVEDAGLHVVSVCCDNASPNRALAKSLGVTTEQPFFANPDPSRTSVIVWFFDVPHILKLLRNHLLDQGFTLGSGTHIGKCHFVDLIQQVDTEVTTNFRLTWKHVNVKDQEKQRVYLAAQLLSRRTALAFRQLFPNDPVKQELADFIEVIDQYFDTMNSRQKISMKDVACGFRIHLAKQTEALSKIKDAISMVKVGKHQEHLPWQSGLLTGVNAIPVLYDYLKSSFDVTYIKTARLNQDGLENTFSRIRAAGGNSKNPGAVEFQQRFRLHILGGCAKMALQHTSVECGQDEDGILTSGVSEDFLESAESDSHLVDCVDDILDHFKECEDAIILEDAEPEIEKNWSEVEGLTYYTGYLAFASKQEELFRNKDDVNKDPELYVASDWIDGLYASGRGLAYPAKSLVQDVQKMQECFEAYQIPGNGLRRNPGYLKGLESKLKDLFPSHSNKLLKKFALSRTKMRMRQIENSMISRQQESLRSKVKKLENAY